MHVLAWQGWIEELGSHDELECLSHNYYSYNEIIRAHLDRTIICIKDISKYYVSYFYTKFCD